MKINAAEKVNAYEWDELVISVGGGYFQCYTEVIYNSICAGAEPMFARALEGQDQCLGIVTGTIARSRIWPFSRYSNWTMMTSTPVASDQTTQTEKLIMSALEKYLRGQGVFSVRVDSYDSVRSEEILSSLGYELSARSEFYVDLSRSLDDIWAKFKGHRRTDIRKAEKLGVVTRRENSSEALQLVEKFQADSMHRRGITRGPMSQAKAENRQKQLAKGNIDIFVTYKEGVPVNASLFGVFNNRPYYHVSGSSQEGYHCCGPVHLIWTAIQTYKEQGVRVLGLGAALEGQTSLYKFKCDFGSEIVSQPIGIRRISKIGTGLHWIRSRLSRG